MTATIPSVRSNLLAAADQLVALIEEDRGRRHETNGHVRYCLRTSHEAVQEALSRLDGLERLLGIAGNGPGFPP